MRVVFCYINNVGWCGLESTDGFFLWRDIEPCTRWRDHLHMLRMVADAFDQLERLQFADADPVDASEQGESGILSFIM